MVYWVRTLLGAACGSIFGALNLSGTLGLAAVLIAIPSVYAVTTRIMRRRVKAAQVNFSIGTEGAFSYVLLWLLFWTLLLNLLYPH